MLPQYQYSIAVWPALTGIWVGAGVAAADPDALAVTLPEAWAALVAAELLAAAPVLAALLVAAVRFAEAAALPPGMPAPQAAKPAIPARPAIPASTLRRECWTVDMTVLLSFMVSALTRLPEASHPLPILGEGTKVLHPYEYDGDFQPPSGM
ncbi:MAG: hypothetical protein ACR2JY_24440 [Chloroflexota bacterium]